jgi:hypothetical protein
VKRRLVKDRNTASIFLRLLRLGQLDAGLVAAVDAIEKQRGFRPPVLVDARIRRSVRAKGFQGAALETLVGNGSV